jgi:hypothetical protein
MFFSYKRQREREFSNDGSPNQWEVPPPSPVKMNQVYVTRPQNSISA